MRRQFAFLCTLFLAVALAACASFTPQSFGEGVAAAKVSVTQVRDTALTLAVAGKITKTEAQAVQLQADVARAGIAAAETMYPTDPNAAMDRLALTMQILKSLQAFLAAHGGAK